MNSESVSPGPIRKRTHLKSAQVAILQESFDSNPLPDSSVRTKLARDLDVTERTIQIWFQNRRAKARKIETCGQLKPNWMNSRHSTPPRYQATFRTMMTPERFEELKQDQHSIRKRPRSISKPELPKSKDLLNTTLNNNTIRAMSEGIPHSTVKSSQYPSTTKEYKDSECILFPVQMIRIGSWTRFEYTTMNNYDVYCYCNTKEFIWRIQAEGHYFRIEIEFDEIKELRLSQEIQMETGDLIGQLEIELNQIATRFSMWRTSQDTEWIRCGDFTEDKQATLNSIHCLQGNYELFKKSLSDLISLVPELSSKIIVIPPTPNTSCSSFEYNGTKPANFSNLMLQSPFYYTTEQQQLIEQQQLLQEQQILQQQQSLHQQLLQQQPIVNEDLYQFMLLQQHHHQQQQQQQQQPLYFPMPTSSLSSQF